MTVGSYEARVAALARLAAEGTQAGLPRVRAGLADSEALVRVAALEAIVELAAVDEETRTAVEKLVQDPDELVRAYAGWALARMGDPRAAAVLAAGLPGEPSAVARAGMLEGLVRLEPDPRWLSALLSLLGDSDPEARAFVSNSLVGVASRENVQRLVADLEAARDAETFPAIREVLESNLRTLRDMAADGDFELD